MNVVLSCSHPLQYLAQRKHLYSITTVISMKRLYYFCGILLLSSCFILYLLKLKRMALSDTILTDENIFFKPPFSRSNSSDEDYGETDYITNKVSAECTHMLKHLHVLTSELQANYHQGDVLLLHGAAYTSATWSSISTIRILSAQGFRTFAVDLPGYGETPALTPDDPPKDKFIGCVMERFELEHPFLVAPSMSGEYAIPFVLEHFNKLAGFVPIAPTSVVNIDPKRFEAITIPTLILFGSRDKSGEAISDTFLHRIPQSTIHEISNAGHACYLDNSREFHVELVKFFIKNRRRN